MMIVTKDGAKLDGVMVEKYFHNLVNLFFKILPIRESEEKTLVAYMQGLKTEMIGCKSLIAAVDDDAMYMSLICTLQYLIDHPDDPVPRFKSDVFKCISLCNKLKARYGKSTGGGDAK